MLKIYGSKMCPDCIKMSMNLDMNKIKYDYVDINESLANLKDLLALRDSNPIFDEPKASGAIGIPAIVQEDGTLTLDWQKVISDLGFEPIDIDVEGQACNIDGTGC